MAFCCCTRDLARVTSEEREAQVKVDDVISIIRLLYGKVCFDWTVIRRNQVTD